MDRATLKGITGIDVFVEDMNPEAERDGLTKAQLQTDVEVRIRMAGIKVTSSPREEDGYSFLYLYLHTLKNSTGLYAVNIDLSFSQAVLLYRNRSVFTVAPTWSVDSVATVGDHRLREVRDSVADLVDQFINAYLEQNPKQ